MNYYNEKDVHNLEIVFKNAMAKKGYTLHPIKNNSLLENQIVAYFPDDLEIPIFRFLEIKEIPTICENGYLVSIEVDLITEPNGIIENVKDKTLAFANFNCKDRKSTKAAFEEAINLLYDRFKNYNKNNPVPDDFSCVHQNY